MQMAMEDTTDRRILAQTRQSTDTVMMVRPHAFTPNPQTAADNSFQNAGVNAPDAADMAAKAYEEVTRMVETLRENGITVLLFEDDGSRGTPDSVFPNNWITTHANGKIGVHPMYAENRRKERREDVLDYLRAHYAVTDLIDRSAAADTGQFLEGTGVLILDRIYNIAYMCRSRRTNEDLLEQFCRDFGYTPLSFDSVDENGTPIYHTNVMMCLGTHFAIIGLDTIAHETERARVVRALGETGREIIDISQEQIAHFAGNALELTNAGGERLLALSQTAYESLSEKQIAQLKRSVRLLPLPIPTLELAGGSVRCMLAEIFLPPKG